MKQCLECGTFSSDDTIFCSVCGKRFFYATDLPVVENNQSENEQMHNYDEKITSTTHVVSFHSGDQHTLALEYVRMTNAHLLTFEYSDLSNTNMLHADNILAVHYADSGAQGDAGAVEFLYYNDGQKDCQILYGNYAYGDLNLDAVIFLLPMLKSLDSRYSFEPPYPFGGKLDIPVGWKYLYMGAMNHLFVRQEIAERTGEFIKTVTDETGGWNAFNAIVWFCGASKKMN